MINAAHISCGMHDVLEDESKPEGELPARKRVSHSVIVDKLRGQGYNWIGIEGDVYAYLAEWERIMEAVFECKQAIAGSEASAAVEQQHAQAVLDSTRIQQCVADKPGAAPLRSERLPSPTALARVGEPEGVSIMYEYAEGFLPRVFTVRDDGAMVTSNRLAEQLSQQAVSWPVLDRACHFVLTHLLAIVPWLPDVSNPFPENKSN